MTNRYRRTALMEAAASGDAQSLRGLITGGSPLDTLDSVGHSAACLAAGLHGVEKNLKLTLPPIEGENRGGENIERLPRTLERATAVFKQSNLARDFFGDAFVEHFAATREWEWRQFQDAVTDWEFKRYFEII